MKPVRIQRKRTKGWKMPANTIYVGRPTKWGNPYKIGSGKTAQQCVNDYTWTKAISYIDGGWLPDVARKELAGKNLACFCPLDQPCHADVLLKIANRPATEGERK